PGQASPEKHRCISLRGSPLFRRDMRRNAAVILRLRIDASAWNPPRRKPTNRSLPLRMAGYGLLLHAFLGLEETNGLGDVGDGVRAAFAFDGQVAVEPDLAQHGQVLRKIDVALAQRHL